MKNKKKFGWWFWRVLLIFLDINLVVVGFSYVNQQITNARDREKFPPPGEMVDIGGYQLHLYCIGQGSPTVILEAGANSWSVVWSRVQDQIAETTQVCAYDRAGFGWSDVSPQLRTASNMVNELYILLTNAGIEGPYIMVGHSYGGALVRLFTDYYPEDVAGMVLVDATHPDQADRLPVDYSAGFTAQMNQFKLLGNLAQLGLLRFGVEKFAPSWNLPEDQLPAYFSMMAQPEYYRTSVAEAESFETSLEQVRETGNLGDLPLVVLTAGQLDEEIASYEGVDADAYRSARMELQQELAALSTNSQLIVAEQSGHLIQLYQPTLVIQAVTQVVDQVQNP